MELDRTDTEILRALQENARLSWNEIARRIRVSVPTVSARVRNLEQSGVLTGYHAAVDPDSLRQVRIVLVVGCRAGTGTAVASTLAGIDAVRWALAAEGERVLAEAALPSRTEIPRFLRRLRRVRGVASVVHYVAVKGYKDAPRARVGPGISATVPCFECGRAVDGEPVRWRVNGRMHFFCCTSCEALFRARYERIRAGVPLRTPSAEH